MSYHGFGDTRNAPTSAPPTAAPATTASDIEAARAAAAEAGLEFRESAPQSRTWLSTPVLIGVGIASGAAVLLGTTFFFGRRAGRVRVNRRRRS